MKKHTNRALLRTRWLGRLRWAGVAAVTLVLAGVITSVAVLGGPETSDTAGPSSDDASPDPAQTIEPTPEPTPTSTSTPSAAADVEPTPQPAAQLIDRSFVSVAVTEDGQPRELVGGTRVRVEFEDRGDSVVVRFNAGCNTFGAEVEITPERVHLSSQFGQTAMLCEPAKSEQDAWLKGFARSDPTWELSGDRLTLSNDTTVIELEAE